MSDQRLRALNKLDELLNPHLPNSLTITAVQTAKGWQPLIRVRENGFQVGGRIYPIFYADRADAVTAAWIASKTLRARWTFEGRRIGDLRDTYPLEGRRN